MTSETYKTMVAAAVAIATLCWTPQETQAATDLYDDFSAALIDRTKWDRSEFVRRVENGVFKSELTRFGSNGSNSLNFPDPAAVTSYQADVTVTEVLNVAARPRARLTGFFFNDGTPGVDQAGEVQGDIGIRHNGNQLQVAFFVERCDNDPCTAFTTLIFDNTRFGPVSLGQTHTLSIAFDFASKKFIFGFDGDTQEVPIPASFTTTFLPSQYTARTGFKFKGISTRVSGIGGPDEGAHIKATFDNVEVNGAPYDDFTADLIDRTKWDRLDFGRRVENGLFKSELTRFGSNGSNNVNFADTAGVNAYQADVTVTALSNTAASARARLMGQFYNDGTPGGGEAGEVFASIEIRTSGSGLKVAYSVFVCGDPNCSTGTDLVFDDTTFGPVNLGETHTLSLAWDGKRFFTFGFDGNTVKFDAAAAPVAGPSKRSFKGIGTRVSGIGGPNEGAHIEATFDNVKLISKTLPLAGVLLLLLD